MSKNPEYRLLNNRAHRTKSSGNVRFAPLREKVPSSTLFHKSQ